MRDGKNLQWRVGKTTYPNKDSKKRPANSELIKDLTGPIFIRSSQWNKYPKKKNLGINYQNV